MKVTVGSREAGRYPGYPQRRTLPFSVRHGDDYPCLTRYYHAVITRLIQVAGERLPARLLSVLLSHKLGLTCLLSQRR